MKTSLLREFLSSSLTVTQNSLSPQHSRGRPTSKALGTGGGRLARERNPVGRQPCVGRGSRLERGASHGSFRARVGRFRQCRARFGAAAILPAFSIVAFLWRQLWLVSKQLHLGGLCALIYSTNSGGCTASKMIGWMCSSLEFGPDASLSCRWIRGRRDAHPVSIAGGCVFASPCSPLLLTSLLRSTPLRGMLG